MNTETATPDPIHDALDLAYRDMLAVISEVTPAQAERLGMFSLADSMALHLDGNGLEPLSQTARNRLLAIGTLLLEAARENLADTRAARLLLTRERLIEIATRTPKDGDDKVDF